MRENITHTHTHRCQALRWLSARQVVGKGVLHLECHHEGPTPGMTAPELEVWPEGWAGPQKSVLIGTYGLWYHSWAGRRVPARGGGGY